jgi:hypothetical protein
MRLAVMMSVMKDVIPSVHSVNVVTRDVRSVVHAVSSVVAGITTVASVSLGMHVAQAVRNVLKDVHMTVRAAISSLCVVAREKTWINSLQEPFPRVTVQK